MNFRAVVAGLLAAISLVAPAADRKDSVLELREARVLVEPWSELEVEPSPTRPDWRTLNLAEQVDNPSFELKRVWVRMPFSVNGRIEPPWAVMMPRLYSGGKVFLNGVPLGQVPGSSPSTQALWLSPHLFPVSIENLRQVDNTLLVSLVSRDARIGIGAPSIGPRDVIDSLYQDRLFWERTVAVMSLWVLLPAALFISAIWFWRRQEVLYGIFGLAAFAWAIRTIGFVWPVVPLELWIPWRALYAGSTALSIVLICIFVLRSAGFQRRWLERSMLAYVLAGPLAVLLLGFGFAHMEAAWYAGVMAFNLLTVGIAGRIALRQRTWISVALLLPPTLMFSAFMRYYALKLGWVAFVNTYWAHIVAPAVVLVMCLLLLVRFVQSLARVENINVELEQRVAEREERLAASYRSVLQMQLAQSSALERQRIVQDMHDGLGSQLLSSLLMVERGTVDKQEIAKMLRDCIDDMRLVLDTLSPHDGDLLSVLGALRFRMAPRLAAVGVSLDWTIDCPLDAVVVNPGESLAILRIMQEAMTNVLKHADGSRLAVAISASKDSLEIRIADDGKGFPADADGNLSPGRGLGNMKRRAASLGATLDIDSTPAGTEILFRKSLVEA